MGGGISNLDLMKFALTLAVAKDSGLIIRATVYALKPEIAEGIRNSAKRGDTALSPSDPLAPRPPLIDDFDVVNSGNAYYDSEHSVIIIPITVPEGQIYDPWIDHNISGAEIAGRDFLKTESLKSKRGEGRIGRVWYEHGKIYVPISKIISNVINIEIYGVIYEEDPRF